MPDYRIIENSWICRVGRIFMKSKGLAMVIGKNILLSGVDKAEFVKDIKWFQHEMVHIEQFKRYGTLKFLGMYLLESARKGYWNNKYEIEARERVKNMNK